MRDTLFPQGMTEAPRIDASVKDKKESQICILAAGGEVLEQRIDPHRT